MCDGILSEKLGIIRELMDMENPPESREYLRTHLAWTLDELKKYKNDLSSFAC
jgi:hypothetical protein